jgi:glycosyltransferase involved in cell wall biosynthesis
VRINIDVSDIVRVPFLSGIQRVVRELVSRAIHDPRLDVRLLSFDPTDHGFSVISPEVFERLMAQPGGPISESGRVAIADLGDGDVFLDVDSSAWNSPLKRSTLYSILSANGVYIVTTLYDFVPVRLPQVVHANILRNWLVFIAAVYGYADLVLPISRATEVDFVTLGREFGATRSVPSLVTKLGGDPIPTVAPSRAELTTARGFLDAPFMLFVGTIEPRKRQLDALLAFQELSGEFPELHLVIVGRHGWHAEETVEAILQHPLSGKRIHWITSASDALISELYDRATVSVYLSEYEGFGLPVIESLSHGTPVIASRNSSIGEAGRQWADYVETTSPSEVAATVREYLRDPGLLAARRAAIADDFTAPGWDLVYETLASALLLVPDALAVRNVPRPDAVPFVFVSSDAEAITRSVAAFDASTTLVSEYLVIAPGAAHPALQGIASRVPIRLVDEDAVVSGEEAADADEPAAAGGLWRRLTAVPGIGDRFVILEAGSVPLGDVELEDFLDPDGRYIAPYWADLPGWAPRETPFDLTQAETVRLLDRGGYELLAYSSRQPHLVDVRLFDEAIRIVDALKPDGPIDVWTAYFNIAATRRPAAFRKEPYRTIDWPASPSDWTRRYTPERYLFGAPGYDRERTESAEALARSMQLSRRLQSELTPIIEQHGLAIGRRGYGSRAGTRLYLSGIPRVIAMAPHSILRFETSYQLVDAAPDSTVRFCYRVDDGEPISVGIVHGTVQHGDLSIPLVSSDEGIHIVTFFLEVDGIESGAFTDSTEVRLVVGATRDDVHRLLLDSGLLTGHGRELPERRAVAHQDTRPSAGGPVRRWAKRVIRFFFPSIPLERQRLRMMSERVDALAAAMGQVAMRTDGVLGTVHDLHDQSEEQWIRIEAAIRALESQNERTTAELREELQRLGHADSGHPAADSPPTRGAR